MIELYISCSMCGRVFSDEPVELDAKHVGLEGIDEILKPRGWIVQQNGENLDTYCSKGCAK